MTTRRRLLQASAAAGTALGLGRHARAQQRPRTYVLIHGAWHGGWCWRKVVPRLAAAGHRVLAPSLPGLAERADLLSAAVGLDTHIDDVVTLLEREDLRDVVLVGHSYGGLVITGVADRAASRLAHLAYLDAVIVNSGEAWSATHSPALAATWARLAAPSGGISVPPPDAGAFGIARTDDRAWVNRQLTPHPYRTYTQPLRLTRPPGAGLRKTHIACRGPGALSAAARRVRIDEAAGWSTRAIDAAHDAMVTEPARLAALLLSLA
ncbi:alpha/beta fold hydrolase [Vineibacter terrae]|uniref:Alpha/beta fold hydrolase n=1 Tax=Vineibacter terrae TaxID=2586908 RepID=A0A5C8PQE2_9HYPH|nr:alpha/beta hydrolase family protein [Vineibacter terrae]TXL77519.1 alpha/beta fold hydrolase [Vineibacter terrae]